jgi:hypothetical protein
MSHDAFESDVDAIIDRGNFHRDATIDKLEGEG